MHNNTILLTIYDDPDKFPPTLNAIQLLCKKYEKVVVIWRGHVHKELNLPKNCICYYVPSKDLVQSTILTKLGSLIKFIFVTLKYTRKHAPNWLICYDLYSFTASIISKFAKKSTKIWYHNHDVTDLAYVRKYSLTYFCWKLEQKYVNKASIFSVPDKTRLKYFKLKEDTNVKVVPNYPLKNYNTNFQPQNPSIFKIFYQGRVADGHGIIELINFLHSHSELPLQFHIIGSYDLTFKKEVITLIEKLSIKDKVFLHPQIPNYADLKSFTKNFHIGLGVMKPLNIQFQTCATASNKIYEYIAFGMPVILYDNDHFQDALNQFSWAHFTDLGDASLELSLTKIISNFNLYSNQAYNDFETSLNFETVFEKINLHLD